MTSMFEMGFGLMNEVSSQVLIMVTLKMNAFSNP
jgi:hypothetical protein